MWDEKVVTRLFKTFDSEWRKDHSMKNPPQIDFQFKTGNYVCLYSHGKKTMSSILNISEMVNMSDFPDDRVAMRLMYRYFLAKCDRGFLAMIVSGNVAGYIESTQAHAIDYCYKLGMNYYSYKELDRFELPYAEKYIKNIIRERKNTASIYCIGNKTQYTVDKVDDTEDMIYLKSKDDGDIIEIDSLRDKYDRMMYMYIE